MGKRRLRRTLRILLELFMTYDKTAYKLPLSFDSRISTEPCFQQVLSVYQSTIIPFVFYCRQYTQIRLHFVFSVKEQICYLCKNQAGNAHHSPTQRVTSQNLGSLQSSQILVYPEERIIEMRYKERPRSH